jgi:hypothetical protein
VSIRPVDVGVMVQRMNEVDRVQQVRDQRAVLAQEQFGQELKVDQERRETEVKAPSDLAKLAVNPDAEKDRKGREGEPHREQEPEAGAAVAEDERSLPPVAPGPAGHRLDIKL